MAYNTTCPPLFNTPPFFLIEPTNLFNRYRLIRTAAQIPGADFGNINYPTDGGGSISFEMFSGLNRKRHI